MGKENLIALIIIVVGILGAVIIWNYRYDTGYNLGLTEGFFEGNHSGFSRGYDEGSVEGTNEGYEEGFDIGKQLGQIDGYALGYQESNPKGEIEGYETGYEEGNSTGLNDGYIAGIIYGSEGYNLRDPTLKEALHFIEMDKTDELYDSNKNISSIYLLSQFKENAYKSGFRCYWVHVEMMGAIQYFCAFNTTDSGLLYVNYYNDIIHDLVIGGHCYDLDIYVAPSYDDTINEIEFTP